MFKYFRDLLQTLFAIERLLLTLLERIDLIAACVDKNQAERSVDPRLRVDNNKY